MSGLHSSQIYDVTSMRSMSSAEAIMGPHRPTSRNGIRSKCGDWLVRLTANESNSLL